MELIRDLGSRTTITSSGKEDKRKWGEFKCPSCGTLVELKMFKGVQNNTCGKAGCRKRASNAYHTSNMSTTDKINNLPHHSSFRDFFSRLDNTTWDNLAQFRNDMYEDYSALKDTVKKVTLYVKDKKPLSKDNCTWVEDKYIEPIDFSLDISEGTKHSLMLAKETGVKPHIVTRTIKKMDSTFGDTPYEVLACPGNLSRMFRAYTLTEYQYNRLRDRVLDTRRTVSSNIYLIEGAGSTKIGMTHDVSKRFKTLVGSSPVPLTLLYSKEVQDASKVEKYLHKKYTEQNHHHEWFTLTEGQVKETVAYLDSL